MASKDRPSTDAKKSRGSAEKLSPAEQSARFKKTARETEADETGQLFEAASKTILKRPVRPS
jgi:hypothetical protein